MKNLIVFLSFLTMFIACTPKTATKVEKPTVEVKPTPSVLDENIKSSADCPTFRSAPKGESAMEAHVIYRDFIRSKDYDSAFEYWKKAYEIAPAADGKRNFHFTDGIRIYEHFYKEETDPARKNAHMEKIMELYDGLAACYGDPGYVHGRKAFDYYYKFPGLKSDKEIYSLFKKSIDADGKKANYFIVNPMTALMVNLYLEEKIPMVEAQKYTAKITDVIAYGNKNAKTAKEKAPWEIINGYAPLRLESLEGVEGFYDCAYFANKYFPEYEADPNDCDIAEATYSRLRWGGCPDSDPQIAKLAPKVKSCLPPPLPDPEPSMSCRDYLREGKYTKAVQCYSERMDDTDDMDKKAQYALTVSKIYYGHLKRYNKSRDFARKAIKYRSGWGEPYILIGKLYASSGPLCGPGRGWDSQVVTWPAIDMWNKAKSVDGSAAADANKLINKYVKYMPSIEDIFQRGLKEGDSFNVGCWIQEGTRIRAAKD